MDTATTQIEIEKCSAEQSRRKLVPKLRFNEFVGEWEKESTGKHINLISGLAFKGEDISEDPSGIPILRGINITEGFIRHNEKIDRYFLGDASKLNKIRVKEGDLVLGMDGSKVGKNSALVSKVDAESLLIQRVARLREKKGSCLSFIYQHINSIRFHKYVDVVNTSSGIPHISSKQINDFKINFPKKIEEQQKIASFLSAVDEKIQQLSKKKALLEVYKKGVMQQLFKKSELGFVGLEDDKIENEENPTILKSKKSQFRQLRFKDENGKDYPDWEEKKFGDLYSFHSTNSLSRDKLNYESGTVYNIHYGDIHTKFKTAFNLTEEYIPFVNDEVDLSKIKLDSYCKNGDIVMADASEDYADIGKSIEIIDLNDKKVLAGLHTFLARPTTSKTAIGFFSFLLKSWSMRKQIMLIAQGSKVLSLSTGRVGQLKLKLPVIEEQQKIATYLSGIDTKIESVGNQISQTQSFKKGLLQQMFV